MRIRVLGVLLTIWSIFSCTADKAELLSDSGFNCSLTPASYSRDIQVIIQNKCATAGCHNRTSASGGVILETYNQVQASAARIRVRVVEQKTMPTNGALPAIEIEKIRCWIDNGAPNN
jgi:uncharacterized membrane protein